MHACRSTLEDPTAEDEYFSDGLADELLNLLAKIKGLRVTARTSSFHFKGKDATIARVGKELDVATVLEGSVRKAGNRVRISVQLVQVSNSSHLWSETYDRTLDDIFAVQDEIAQSVVKELRTTLLGEEVDSRASGEAKAEVSRAARGRATNPHAHRLYLQARYLTERATRVDVAKAIEYLKQALALEPEFALAWAELSWAQAREANLAWAPIEEGYRRRVRRCGGRWHWSRIWPKGTRSRDGSSSTTTGIGAARRHRSSGHGSWRPETR